MKQEKLFKDATDATEASASTVKESSATGPSYYRVPHYKTQLVREATTHAEPENITSPRAVFNLFESLQHEDRENFCALFLSTKNKPIGLNTISIGSLNASIVHPREVFKPALLASASAIILVHNHPSGDPNPSQEDLQVTRRLVEAGNILGVEVKDHVVIGDGCYCSFKEKDLI